jgi:hypothetical protein
VVEGAIVSDNRCLTDHDSHAMIDKKSPANLRARMNLYPRQQTGKIRQHAGYPFQIQIPQTVGQAMEKKRVNPRIGGNDFKSRARRGITFKYTLNILAPSGNFLNLGFRLHNLS